MRIEIFALSVLCLISSAPAQMSPVSRHSRVYAWEHFIDMGHNDLGVSSSEHTTDGFEPFDWEFQIGGYTAIQHSSISMATVSIVAGAFGTPQSTFGYGGGESSMTFTFDILSPATFHLAGTVASMIGVGSVSLEGPGVSLVADTPGTNPTPFLFEGEMVPGRYTLSVLSTADYGSVSAVLDVIPSPGACVLLPAGLMALRRRPHSR